jgi:hypothetical protein
VGVEVHKAKERGGSFQDFAGSCASKETDDHLFAGMLCSDTVDGVSVPE